MGNKKSTGQLTAKETKVISLLADGYMNQEVAQMLGITIRTVEGYRAKIMLKLDIHSFIGLVKYALKHNITTLDKHRDDPRLPS